MPFQSRFAFCIALFSAILLSACGGGGAGEGGAAIPSIPNAPVIPTTPSVTVGVTVTPTLPPVTISSTTPTAQLVTVEGTVQFDKVSNNPESGALDYSSIRQSPVRGATVELIVAGLAIASTQTNASGKYVFTSAPRDTTMAVRVRVELKQTSGPAQWDVSVRDNTNDNALYSMQSESFNSGSGMTQNLTAGAGWGGTRYTTARTAGPFAILDTIYESQQKVLALQPNTTFPLLNVFWSINNNTSRYGSVSSGDIGTSFFTEVGNRGAVTERQIYVVGRENNDTDEYDSSVIAHEWGHYFQSAFSRDESMFGRHGGSDDRLDRRIAFSEGWGNAWANIALSSNVYADSSGFAQGQGFAYSVSSDLNASIAGFKGWFREKSVQAILWNLSNQAGLKSVLDTLQSSEFRSHVALPDIHLFAHAYRATTGGAQSAILNGLLSGESISSNSDAFGSQESNNGGMGVTLPYYRQISALGSPVSMAAGQSLCTNSQFAPIKNSISSSDNDRNKLGMYVYARFTNPLTAMRTIRISGSPEARIDVDFELFRAGERVYVAETESSSEESRTAFLTAGDYVLSIYDYNKTYPGNTCYTVSIE